MTEILYSSPVLVIEYWNLRFTWDLVLGIWNFGSEKLNYGYGRIDAEEVK